MGRRPRLQVVHAARSSFVTSMSRGRHLAPESRRSERCVTVRRIVRADPLSEMGWPMGRSPAFAIDGTTVFVRLVAKSFPEVGFSVWVIADQTIFPLTGSQTVVSNFTN